jgi:Tol biopolymer transport system component
LRYSNFMRKPWLMAAFLCGCGTLAAEKPFTLEQVMANPFPEHLVAAPAGGRVAWQMNARGARNIWVAAPPDYRGRQITAFTQDDGQDIGEMSWTPDGRSIVFVRGGDFDMRREAPNARSNPEGVEQGVWVIAADGGTPRKLGEGQSPAISPKGDQVAFLYKDQIWRAPLDGNGKAEQAVHSRGTAAALRWSPDGSKLAFVSGRGNHSFIGVFDPAAKSVRYLDPSVDRDNEPAWSPDSHEIAFVRIPASADSFAFGPKMTADEPWSIRAAEVASGHGRQIWRAEPGRGSAFQAVVAQKQLLWANGRLVFPWERTGWVHLYSVSVQGGSTTELTPGEFEVEHVTDSRTAESLCFRRTRAIPTAGICGRSR